MDWDGSDHARLNLAGQASYTPGTGDRLQASGDPQVLAHLRIREGTVELDCRGWRDRTQDLVITLPGRSFDKFGVTGGRLILDRLDQQRLSVSIAGSGKVQANGRIEDLKLSIAGSGEMDLGQITANRGELEHRRIGHHASRERHHRRELEMDIAGSGRAEFNQIKSRTAEIGIAGSGTVIAKGTVDDLKIDISGSGRADFGEVVSRTANAEISGHGDVAIAPRRGSQDQDQRLRRRPPAQRPQESGNQDQRLGAHPPDRLGQLTSTKARAGLCPAPCPQP